MHQLGSLLDGVGRFCVLRDLSCTRNGARANLNSRILPGEPVDLVRATLVRVLADDKISVTPVAEADLPPPPPPLTPTIMEPVKAVANEMWPGVPVIPTMLVVTSDGCFLNNAGIWAYGVSGMFVGVEGIRRTQGATRRMTNSMRGLAWRSR